MLQITDLTLRIAGRPLIEGASLTLPDGSKAGLVGRNGAGKTTLFRAIVGEISPDAGSISVPKGTRIIDAAARVGVDILHYCYHEALSAPAQCRMCLVEMEKSPKLVPACVTTVAEGSVILTQSEKALKSRTGTLEFYLINHPLD